MTNDNRIQALLRATILLGATTLTGCPGDDTGMTGGSSESTAGPAETVGTESSTSRGESSSSSSSSAGTLDGVDSTTDTGDDPFVFPTDPYDAYTQIDRHGAVEAGTAGILASAGLGLGGEDLSLRDDYNASNPTEDAAGMWVPEISDSVSFFHNAIDDDLMALGLTPATVDQSLAQAGPVIVPDAIKYDPSIPTGYPNGRALTDPVVDITFAAVLLDLDTHALTTFADLPLNPPENDVPFLDEFPYLAPPHAP